MPTILSLPPETIHEIGLQLDGRDNRSLRLVCNQIYIAIESLGLSRLFIDVNPNSFNVIHNHLKTLSKRVAGYVRTVIIYHSNEKGRLKSAPSDRNAMEGNFNDLYPYLLKLSNVDALSWFTDRRDAEAIINVVVKYCQERPILDLSLDFNKESHPGLPMKLLELRGLERLRLKNTVNYHPRVLSMIFVALSTAILHSPGLSLLEIDTGHVLLDETSPSLHDILPSIETSSIALPIPLKTLSVRNLRIVLDNCTLYHLRSLESLSIHFNLMPATHGSRLSEIWATLRKESICLTRIDVGLTEVDDALLDYLLSYQGIRELVFYNSARLWGGYKKSDMVANRFFSEVLPKISTSLETLHLEAVCPDVWCFGIHNASTIGLCQNLRELTVSVVDLIQNHSKETLALLDATAARLLKLRYLKKVNVATVPQIG